MSAIAGVFHRHSRPVDPGMLQAMVARQLHRGPDNIGTWQQGCAGLGHGALHVTPESVDETLPSADRNARLILTADVRLDNRDELIRLLHLETGSQAVLTDSDLILHAYQAWGTDCPTKLLGDFAFAIWDEPEQRVFIARDHFGTKPLTYYLSHDIFVFASEIKALFCHANVPRRINAQRVADYLVPYFESYNKQITFYEDIWRLPPAHIMIVSRRHVTLRCYWTPDIETERRYASDDDYAEAFRDVLTQAVESRLRSAFPVAAMLSDGMDSSSIVWTARDILARAGRSPLHTISAIAHNALEEQIETQAIEQVIQTGGLVAHTISPGQLIPHQDRLMQLLHSTDNLFDFVIYPIMVPIYNLAHQQGIRRVMDGLDGDTVIWVWTRCLPFLLRHSQIRDAMRVAFDCARFFQESPWSYLLRAAVSAWFPAWLVRHLQGLMQRRLVANALSASVINRDFTHRLELPERYQQYLAANMGRAQSIRADHAASINASYMTVAFERYDRIAAACSVEACRPLLDKRVVDFCIALPWQHKALGGWSKPVLRRAMHGRLPSEILTRRNFESVGPCFAYAWWKFEHQLIEHVVNEQIDNIREYVDITAVRQAYQRCQARCVRYDTLSDEDSIWNDGDHVWTAVTLSLWLSRNT